MTAPADRGAVLASKSQSELILLLMARERECAELVAMLWAVMRLHDTRRPLADVAYRQGERKILSIARALLAQRAPKKEPDHPTSGSCGND